MPRTKDYAPDREPMRRRDTARWKKAKEQIEANTVPAVGDPSTSGALRLAQRSQRYQEDAANQKLIEADRKAPYRPYYLTRKNIAFTPDKKEIFIFALAEFGTVAKAAEAAGISSSTAFAHRNENNPRYDPDFAEAWAEAAEEYNASVEQEIHNRAINGWQEPVFGGKDRDQIVGHVTKKSDRLLVTLAKRRMPDKYGDRIQVADDRNPARSSEIAPGLDLAHLNADQRKKLKSFLSSVDGVDRSEIIDVEAEDVKEDD